MFFFLINDYLISITTMIKLSMILILKVMIDLIFFFSILVSKINL